MDHEEDDEPEEPTQPPSSYVGYDSNDKNIFRVLSLNVQSMNNKFDAIRAIADSTGTSIPVSYTHLTLPTIYSV